MSVEFVLDASVSLAWFLPETGPRAAYAARVAEAAAQGAILHVPTQWGVEMGHVLIRERRAQVLTNARFKEALADLDELDLRVHLQVLSPRQTADLATRYHLQGYDAVYFDLAVKLSLPLATLDRGQLQAAISGQVALFAEPPSGPGSSRSASRSNRRGTP